MYSEKLSVQDQSTCGALVWVTIPRGSESILSCGAILQVFHRSLILPLCSNLQLSVTYFVNFFSSSQLFLPTKLLLFSQTLLSAFVFYSPYTFSCSTHPKHNCHSRLIEDTRSAPIHFSKQQTSLEIVSLRFGGIEERLMAFSENKVTPYTFL